MPITQIPPQVRTAAALPVSKGTKNAPRWFRCLLYGETNTWKSTTAARFGSPKSVRIIMTRNPEQLIPVTDEGYIHEHCPEKGKIVEVLTNPVKIFGNEWGNHPERTLILDDISYFRELSDEDAATGDGGRAVKDVRRLSFMTKKVMWNALCRNAMNHPQNFICIGLQDEWTEQIPPYDKWIDVSLPPKVRSLVTGPEFEYAFYSSRLRGHDRKLLTDSLVVKKPFKDDKGTEYLQETHYFAKNKIPFAFVGKKPSLIELWEEPNLRAIWDRVRTGKR